MPAVRPIAESHVPSAEDPLIGQVIGERYVVERFLAEGGMGAVYLARQEPVGRPVALKILLPEFVTVPGKLARFQNEARILAGLRHPHTVRLVDFGHLPGGRLYLAMEYIGGGTLEDALALGRLSEGLALRIARQILGALVEAHSYGVIHRDLKPSNVLFDHVAGEQAMVRVADFGIARFNPLDGHDSQPPAPVPAQKRSFGLQTIGTLPGVRLGSPAYISPEQAFARPVDGRSDLYSLGVMLYEMLAGHRPFVADSDRGLYLAQAHEAAPLLGALADLQLDPATEALVARLLSKDPAGRPASAAEALAAVDAILARLTPTPLARGGLDTLPALARAPEASDPVLLRAGPPGWAWGLLVAGLLLLAALWLLR